MSSLDQDSQQFNIAGGNFNFSGARIENLGASEYTLVTIAVDETGSVHGFHDELRDALVAAVDACKRSPRSDNLMLRVLYFGSQYRGGVREIHGFKPLSEIDPNDYPDIQPQGGTPLCDAAYSSIGALVKYGEDLMDQDFLVNGIAFVITDGGDNCSIATEDMIREQIESVYRDEKIESLVSVLIGINASQYKQILTDFQKAAGFDQYIDAGEASKSKLAKLADFVSQSVSSQSQSLGTGGPSQNISATF